jgi:hypothetical protein
MDEQLSESVEPTYVDLYVQAVATEDEESLTELLQFAAMFQDVGEEPNAES